MTSTSSPSDPLHGLNPEELLELVAQGLGERDTVPLVRSDLPSLEEVAQAFPDLEVEELIGRGGMSAVFRARQPRLNRVVALKVLPKSLAAIPGFAERFTREGQVLARLSHPHIVTVHDFGERDGFWFLIMEHVDGVNLRQAMRAGRFTPEQALEVIPAICDALQFAHGQGVLHRDIKPENILLDAKGGIKIADFGIAKILGEEAEGGMLLTQSGAKLGTAPYMAPEQIEKPASVDHRADIYSLGVVFYEMLTGELPLGRFAAPSELAGVGGGMDAVVFRALEKERARRQQSAEEFKTQVAGAGSVGGQRRFSWLTAVAFACLMGCGLLVVWAMFTESFVVWTLIPGAVTVAGLTMVATALPLWLRQVPMNAWYGLRLPSTMIHEERWYEANAFAGRKLCEWSVPVVGAGVAGFFQLPRHQDYYGWAVLALSLTAVVAVCVSVWSWLRHHPVKGPVTKPSRLAKQIGNGAIALVVALFIKSFILETYRIAQPDAGLTRGSHWIASRLDTGFAANEVVVFEHENGTPWTARVAKKEDKGLLLKRGGVEEEFFVEWDRVIGKLLFSHFSPAAVKAAGEVEDMTPDPEPPIEGTATALEQRPLLRFLQIMPNGGHWQQPVYSSEGQMLNNDETMKLKTLGGYIGSGNKEDSDLCWMKLWFEHPDFDEASVMGVTLTQPDGQPLQEANGTNSRSNDASRLHHSVVSPGRIGRLPDRVHVTFRMLSKEREALSSQCSSLSVASNFGVWV